MKMATHKQNREVFDQRKIRIAFDDILNESGTIPRPKKVYQKFDGEISWNYFRHHLWRAFKKNNPELFSDKSIPNVSTSHHYISTVLTNHKHL